MHHGVIDLDSRGPSIGQDAANFAFQDRHQRRSKGVVGFRQVKGGGELPFETAGGGDQVLREVYRITRDAAPKISSCRTGLSRNCSLLAW